MNCHLFWAEELGRFDLVLVIPFHFILLSLLLLSVLVYICEENMEQGEIKVALWRAKITAMFWVENEEENWKKKNVKFQDLFQFWLAGKRPEETYTFFLVEYGWLQNITLTVQIIYKKNKKTTLVEKYMSSKYHYFFSHDTFIFNLLIIKKN